MPKKLFVLFTAITLMGIVPCPAKEIGGVNLPDSLTVGKDTLVLNGAGLRKKFIIKVYACGLYLVKKNSGEKAILDADEPMAIRMNFIYKKVESDKLVDAWNEGFENGGADIAPLKDKIAKFNSFFTADAKEGDVYDIKYVPGKGLDVEINGAVKGTIPGLDFKKAVFAIWLGKEPPNESLKEGMLGK